MLRSKTTSFNINWHQVIFHHSIQVCNYSSLSFPVDSWPANPDQLSIPGDQTTAVIKDLDPASAFHFRVIAQNVLGFSLPSEIIQATTEEEGKINAGF